MQIHFKKNPRARPTNLHRYDFISPEFNSILYHGEIARESEDFGDQKVENQLQCDQATDDLERSRRYFPCRCVVCLYAHDTQ